MNLTSAARLVASSRPLVIAHRGDSRVAPENTLPAFLSALTTGADLVELDYFHTADGVPVVFHDDVLDNKTDARAVLGREKLSIADVSLANVRRLDAGAWFSPAFAGTTIPTLAEALAAIHPASVPCIERKGGDAAGCVRLLEDLDLLERVVVMAFAWDFLADFHRLAPQTVLVALGEKTLQPQHVDQARAAGANIIAWDHQQLGGPEVAAIHQAGLRAWAYTINDPDRAQQLIDQGLDAVITDIPAAILPQLRPAS